MIINQVIKIYWILFYNRLSYRHLKTIFNCGDSNYKRYLKNFLDSSASTAYITYQTHCVNRGYVGGDPMYDYVIDPVSFTY